MTGPNACPLSGWSGHNYIQNIECVSPLGDLEKRVVPKITNPKVVPKYQMKFLNDLEKGNNYEQLRRVHPLYQPCGISDF